MYVLDFKWEFGIICSFSSLTCERRSDSGQPAQHRALRDVVLSIHADPSVASYYKLCLSCQFIRRVGT